MELTAITLTRKELYNLVWSNSLLTLSKRFSISDTGLRKICKKMNIPLPSTGHWMKLQFNKKVKIIALAEDSKVDQTVKLELRKEGDPVRSSNPVKELTKQFSFTVPEKLSSHDPLIAKAKQRLSGNDVHNRHPGIISCLGDELDIAVAPKHVGRALRFMDTLIKALRTRHHQIEIQNWKTYVIVKGETMQIKFREKMKRVVINERQWGNTELQSTGLLCFRVDGYYGKEWTDSKDGVTLLESKLSEIVAWLEIEGQRKADETAYYHKLWERREAEMEKERQIKRRKEEEMTRFQKLLDTAGRWKQAAMIREYVETVERSGEVGSECIEWARKKADWLDPVTGREDEELGLYDEK